MAKMTPRRVFGRLRRVLVALDEIRQMSVIESWNTLTDRPDNPLTARPRRYWSQADEDGILEQILHRIGPRESGVFVEYGVGDGAQCNTLVLLAKGWKGAWISGERIAFEPRRGGRLLFQRAWVTRDNIVDLTDRALARLGTTSPNRLAAVDVVSLDLDGNDFHIAEKLLSSGLKPRIWITEYNARFPVGSHWIMAYNDEHSWEDDDYYGASISSFTALFESHGYFPVACSAQGSNVFFVRGDFSDSFGDVPKDLDRLYRPLLSFTRKWGHKESGKTLESLT